MDEFDYIKEKDSIKQMSINLGGIRYSAHSSYAQKVSFLMHRALPLGSVRQILSEIFDVEKVPSRMKDFGEGRLRAIHETYFKEGQPTKTGISFFAKAWEEVQKKSRHVTSRAEDIL